MNQRAYAILGCVIIPVTVALGLDAVLPPVKAEPTAGQVMESYATDTVLMETFGEWQIACAIAPDKSPGEVVYLGGDAWACMNRDRWLFWPKRIPRRH